MASSQIIPLVYLILLFSGKCSTEISTANNQFGLKIYSALADHIDGDFLISPFPISSLLAQLNLGVDGITSKEIKNVIELKGDVSEISNDYRRILSDFSKLESLDGVLSQIFVNETVELLEEFEESSQTNFFSTLSKINLNSSAETVDEINSWILNATGQSKQVWVSEDSLDSLSMSMVLVTTSFFKGSWVNSFHPFDTKPSPFYYDECRSCANQVDMMFQRAQVPYAEIEELDCTSIALPYRNNFTSNEDKESRIELIILLPNTRTGLKELERKLKNYSFSQITRRFLVTKDLFIYMPKLNIKSPPSLELEKVLSKLGLESGLNPEKADFSKIQANNTNNPLWITKAYQFAEFSVDEFGTKGFGSAVLRTSTNHYSPESFRVNRPFIGVIYDQERHIILNIFRKTS